MKKLILQVLPACHLHVHGSTLSFSQVQMDIFFNIHMQQLVNYLLDANIPLLLFVRIPMSLSHSSFSYNGTYWRSISTGTYECGFEHIFFPSTTVSISGEQLVACIMWGGKAMHLHPWPP